MLLRLEIKNFVLIESAVLEFCPTLNIITGETGSGKSLILASLEACFGGKVSDEQISSEANKATVTCVLRNTSKVKNYLESLGISSFDEIILRREISKNNRSRCFINDTLCSATTIKSIAMSLLDIHGQHAYHGLLNSNMQKEWLDTFANVKEELQLYQETYKKWILVKKELLKFTQQKQNLKMDKEYISFCIQELEGGLIDVDYYNSLSEIIKSLENKKKISSFSNQLFEFCLQQINTLEVFVKKGSSLSTEVEELTSKLQILLSTTEKIKDTLAKIDTSSEEDIDETIDQYHSILSKVDSFRRKYDKTLPQLWDLLNELQTSFKDLENIDSVMQELEQQKEMYQKNCIDMSMDIRKKRKDVIKNFCEEIKKRMDLLGMSSCVFSVDIQPLQELTESGMDHIEFYYSPSEKIPSKKLQSIISGGELSRISLSLYCILGDKKKIQTLFFDEIDTGIGGENALHMGRLLQQLSEKNQIILITHVPQIAKFSQKHFFVSKESPEKSSIQELSYQQKVKEIARMIRGDSITKEDLIFSERFIKEFLSDETL